MASPDISQYIELVLLDRDPQDIFDIAITNMKASLPDWTPREGNIEVLLLENMAIEVAESVFAINRLIPGIVEVLLSMLDIQRDSGNPPQASVRFDLGITTGTTIPAGTTLVLELDSGLEPIVFTTNAELVVLPGETYGIVSATGDRFTSDANTVPAETLLELQDSITYVDYVRLNSPVTNGREPERDIDYLTRGVQRLQRLTTTLTLPRHFESAALENAYIKKAFALDNYDSSSDVDNNGPAGNDPGYISIALYGDNEFVSAEDKADLQSYFDANSMANLIVTIIDPTITEVDVTASIRIDNNVLPSTVIDAVQASLEDFISPMNWNWGKKIRKNELISIITNVPGVDYVESITLPANDLTLPGVAPLADAGVINILVVTD